MKPEALLNGKRLAVAIWLLVVGANVVQTAIMPSDTFERAPQFRWIIVLMPLIIIVGAFQTKRLPGQKTFGTWIDQRYGPGSCEKFIHLLRPELMFGVMCLCIALGAIVRASLLNSPVLPPQLIGFFVSGGVAFLIADYIRRSRTRSGP